VDQPHNCLRVDINRRYLGAVLTSFVDHQLQWLGAVLDGEIHMLLVVLFNAGAAAQCLVQATTLQTHHIERLTVMEARSTALKVVHEVGRFHRSTKHLIAIQIRWHA